MQYIVDNISTELSYEIDVKENTLKLQAGFDAVTNRQGLEETNPDHVASGAIDKKPTFLETFGERRYNLGATYSIKSINKLQAAFGYEFRLFQLGNDLSGQNANGLYPEKKVISNVNYINNSAFFEGLYELNDKAKINFGLRYDVHTRTARFGGALSPKLAIIYSLHKSHIFNLGFSGSARNGTADNYEFNRVHFNNDGSLRFDNQYQFADVENKTSPILPPVTSDQLHELKPEKAYSIEFNSIHHLFKGLNVSQSTSYNTLKDLYVWSPALFRIINGAKYNFINIDLEISYTTKKVRIGANHTFQKPINNKIEDASTTFETPQFTFEDGNVSCDSALVNGVMNFYPVEIPGETVIHTINSIEESVTYDGKDFTNLATNVSKIFVHYSPIDWLTLHSNIRVFYKLQGREKMHKENESFFDQDDDLYNNSTPLGSDKNPFLRVHNSPIIKWNFGLRFHPTERLKVSFMMYDILATKDSLRHTVRWQQNSTIDQTDLYSMDYRSYGFSATYKF
ncbi:MAG: TonB-dependent receptor [Reichenbachiella sp.]